MIVEPKAILCISAHWYTKGAKFTAIEQPKTIHDFMGFPPKLFNVQYPAKGEPALAGYTQSILDKCLVKLEDKWGLDH